jgi:hypothetical protein
LLNGNPPVRSTLGRRTAAAARAVVLAAAATGMVVTGAFVAATPVAAAGPKVVVVVGPTNGSTSTYISRAKAIAAQARSLGASVTEIYTPHATWSKVSAAARGAKLFVYLGHGSGYPSPYGYHPTRADGMGLNPYDGSGKTSPVKYYGESLIASTIRFAPGAVVLLNHLCYASGGGEPGMAEPSWSVARHRVDNYAAGFISAGAGAVIADAYTNVSSEVSAILKGRNILAAWRADPNYNDHERSFASQRHSGYRNYLDPTHANSVFYRALTTKPGFTTAAAPALKAKTTTRIVLRKSASEHGTRVTTVASGATVTVTGRLATDSRGRTWAPVRTSSGRTGWMAAWLLSFSGSAKPVVNEIVRSSASTGSSKVTTVKAGTRVMVLKSTRDRHLRVWFNVRTSSGRTGWLAAWLMRP